MYYVVNPRIKWRNEKEGLVIIDTGLIINKTGGCILDATKQPVTFEEIIDIMKKTYNDVPVEMLKEDTRKCITQFMKSNILYEYNDKSQNVPYTYSTPYYLKYIKTLLNNVLKAPLGVACELTNRCNVNCVHCCVSANDINYKELSTETWKGIINQLAESEVFACTFTGGEALLREDLLELIQYATSLSLNTSILTNGKKLNEVYIDDLIEKGLKGLIISIDGTSEIHDKFRCSKGLFDHIVSIIPKIIKSKIGFGVVTVINKSNINNIPQLIKELDNLGVKNLSLAYYRLAGRGKLNDMLAPSPEDYKKVIRSVHNYIKINKSDMNIKFPNLPVTYYIDALGENEYWNLFKKGKIGLCGAGIVGAVITPDGNVKPCDMSGDTICGNVLKQSFKEIWLNSKQMRELRKLNEFDLSPCNKCEYNSKHLCLTGCKSMPYQFDEKGNHLCKADYIRSDCYESSKMLPESV